MTKPAASRHADIIAVLLALREGEVVSYGDVAEAAGLPGRSRLVGHLLAAAPGDVDLPWWRVVNAGGRLVPGHESEQARLLGGEGVVVSAAGRVVSSPFGRFAARSPGR